MHTCIIHGYKINRLIIEAVYVHMFKALFGAVTIQEQLHFEGSSYRE